MQNPWKYASMLRTVSTRIDVRLLTNLDLPVAGSVLMLMLSISPKVWKCTEMSSCLASWKFSDQYFVLTGLPRTRVDVRRKHWSCSSGKSTSVYLWQPSYEQFPIILVSHHLRCVHGLGHSVNNFLSGKNIFSFFHSFLSSDLAQGNPRFVLDWKIK